MGSKLIERKDVIVHFAAETGTGQSMYEIEKYVDVNINGTAILLDLLANNPNSIKKVVVASSRSIYGEGKYIQMKGNCLSKTPNFRNIMDKGDFEVKYAGCEMLNLLLRMKNLKFTHLLFMELLNKIKSK